MSYGIRLGILFAVYAATARLGLQVEAVAGFASLVWPPTGIALVAMVLGGYGLWPAIAAAAFGVNFAAGAPVWVAAMIGAGNTSEALLGAYLLRDFARFQPSLTRVRDVLALVVMAAMISPLVSATVGVTGLWLGDLLGTSSFLNAWSTWWLGDAMGSIIVAPLLLVWAGQPTLRFSTSSRLAEGVLLAGVLIAVSLLVFHGTPGAGRHLYLAPYLVSPALIWAALRFDPRGAATAIFTVSALAVWGAQRGRGPFIDPVLEQSLFSLQLYMGITAATMLMLAAAMAEMRNAIRTRDDFLSIASHELNTPLTALKMQVQLILHTARKAAVDPQKVLRLSEKADQQVTRLARLVDTLLDVARISVGRLLLTVEEVDLGQLVRNVVALCEGPGQERPVIEVDTGMKVTGHWDRLRLEQLVANLVTNALKYGGGKPIAISVRREGESAILTVQDQGIGIPPSRVPFIFERFERAVSERSYSGLGLGLYICRQIAEAHGGSIQVRSKPGEGACFTVRIPLN